MKIHFDLLYGDVCQKYRVLSWFSRALFSMQICIKISFRRLFFDVSHVFLHGNAALCVRMYAFLPGYGALGARMHAFLHGYGFFVCQNLCLFTCFWGSGCQNVCIFTAYPEGLWI